VREAEAGRRGLGLSGLIQDRYLQPVAALLCLQVFVFFAVDNTFYFALQTRLGSGEALAAFLGHFLVALGVLSLLFRLGLSSRWRRWFGLRSALLSTPATLLVLGALAAFTHATGEPAATVLGLVVLLKLWERIAVEAIHSPSYYSLFLPLPAEERASAQSTLESVVAQTATLGASLVLLMVVGWGTWGLGGLLISTIAGSSAWALTILWVSSNYREALRGSLAARRIEPGALPIADVTTLDLIAEGTRSPAPTQVLRSLEILEELGAPDLDEVAAELLGHDSERVLMAAAAVLERHPRAKHAVRLETAIRRARQPRTKAGLLQAFAACAGPHGFPLLRAHIERPAAVVRAAAARALLHHGDPRGQAAGRAAIRSLIASRDPGERALGAEFAGVESETARHLLPLLEDEEVGVARAAARAAASLSQHPEAPALARALARALDRDGLSATAARSLEQLGDAALPVLESRLTSSRPETATSLLTDQVLLRALARWPGPAAEGVLQASLKTLSRRRAALTGLDQRASPRSSRSRFERLLQEELQRGATLRLAAPAHPPLSDHLPLTRRLLADELADAQDRILMLAGRLYGPDPLREARRHRGTGNPETLALALELVETTLPEALARRVVPILDLDCAGLERRLRGLATNLDSISFGLPWLAPCLASERSDACLEGELAIMNALAQARIFEYLRCEQLALLARHIEVVDLAKGELLSTEGPAALCPWPGSAALWPSDLALLRAAPEGPKPALTAPDDGRWLIIERTHLERVFEESPDAAWRVLEHLCDRAQAGQGGHATPHERVEPHRDLAYSELLRRMGELESIPGLSRASSRALAAVAKSARERDFAPGQLLMREGDLDSTLVVLIEGAAEVRRGQRLVARVAAPTVFGELAAIRPAPRNATIVAQLPCRALVLPREALYTLMLDDSAVVELMLELVIARLPETAVEVSST
ncbi:MAG: cyclic nucleotide-binding domain-containing protein, partial [Myxococcota bacterium]